MRISISLATLLNTYQIIIPIIQREYAQGRNDEAGQEVRKNFIPALVEVLCDEKKSLSLDFIFGTESEHAFVPLDGQQRLTTLLLLYWYFGVAQTNWQFRYDCRRIADLFVQKLLGLKGENDELPSALIRKQLWFNDFWMTDPTVSGMLTTLDAIHKVVHDNLNRSRVCKPEKLERITFYLHILEKVEADEAYTKMNARGKALTKWENIQAVLDKQLSVEQRKEWNIKGQWLENIENLVVDSELLKTSDDLAVGQLTGKLEESIRLVNIALRNIFDLAVTLYYAEDSSKTDDGHELIQLFHDHKALISDYKNRIHGNNNEWLHDTVFAHARMLYKAVSSPWLQNAWTKDRSNNALWYESSSDTDDFKHDFLKNERYSYSSCARYYAFALWSRKYPQLDPDATQRREMMVILNLLDNMPVAGSQEFIKAIKIIKTLSDSNPFSEGLKKLAEESDQAHEEWIKWEKIEDQALYPQILEAESTLPFQGTIRFLYRDEQGEVQWNEFKDKLKHAQKLFSKESLRDSMKEGLHASMKDFIGCFFDDKIKKTWHRQHCFCSASFENWKALLTDQSLVREIDAFLLKKTVERSSLPANPFKEELLKIFELKDPSSIGESFWLICVQNDFWVYTNYTRLYDKREKIFPVVPRRNQFLRQLEEKKLISVKERYKITQDDKPTAYKGLWLEFTWEDERVFRWNQDSSVCLLDDKNQPFKMSSSSSGKDAALFFTVDVSKLDNRDFQFHDFAVELRKLVEQLPKVTEGETDSVKSSGQDGAKEP